MPRTTTSTYSSKRPQRKRSTKRAGNAKTPAKRAGSEEYDPQVGGKNSRETTTAGAGSSGSTSRQQKFADGTKVVVGGLTSTAGKKYNNQTATVAKYLPQKGRYRILLDESRNYLTCGPENLRAAPAGGGADKGSADNTDTGDTEVLTLDENTTLGVFRQMLAKNLDVDVNQIQLSNKGELLPPAYDGETLKELNIGTGESIECSMLSEMNIGDKLSVLSPSKKWRDAIIKLKKRDRRQGLMFKVHYSGFHDKWDEWIAVESDRIRPWQGVPRKKNTAVYKGTRVEVYSQSKKKWCNGAVKKVDNGKQMMTVQYKVGENQYQEKDLGFDELNKDNPIVRIISSDTNRHLNHTPDTDVKLPNDLKAWKYIHVKAWAMKTFPSKIAPLIIKDTSLNGPKLLTITAKYLNDINVTNKIHQKYILTEVKKLAPNKSTVSSANQQYQRTINDLLKTERDYIDTLSCIVTDYKDPLLKCITKLGSNQDRKEVELEDIATIFSGIDEFLKYHRVFLVDARSGSHIGKLVVVGFKHFKAYADYLITLEKALDTIRVHNLNTTFIGKLLELRKKSKLPEKDLNDLLLAPIDRVEHYKNYINQLSKQSSAKTDQDYDTLLKAERRLGRVANWCGQFRSELRNKSEMNKTQQFIGKQLDIIPKQPPVRKIIRRGPLTRHPESSFSSGKKYYIFFLFNDILLWVQTNRVIQNVVNLKTCTITSCKGYSKDRKMFILGCETFKEKVSKKKKLILEARNVEEREGWFAAITNAIKAITNPPAQTDTKPAAKDTKSSKPSSSKSKQDKKSKSKKSKKKKASDKKTKGKPAKPADSEKKVDDERKMDDDTNAKTPNSTAEPEVRAPPPRRELRPQRRKNDGGDDDDDEDDASSGPDMGPDRMQLNVDPFSAVRRLSLASEELNFYPDMPDLPDSDDDDDDADAGQAFMSLGTFMNKGGTLGGGDSDEDDDYDGKNLSDLRRLSMSSVMSSAESYQSKDVIAL